MKKILTTFIASLTLASCGSAKKSTLKTYEKFSSLKSEQYFHSKLTLTDSTKKDNSYKKMDFETFLNQHLKNYLDYYLRDYGKTEYGTNPHYTKIEKLLKNYKFYNKDLNKLYKFTATSYSSKTKRASNKLKGFTKAEIKNIRKMVASYLVGKGNVEYKKPFLKLVNDNFFKIFGKNSNEFASFENIKDYLKGLDTKPVVAQNPATKSHLGFDTKPAPNYKMMNYELLKKRHLKPYLSAFYENYEQTKGFKELENLLKNHKFYKNNPNTLIYNPKRTELNELLHMSLSYMTRVSFEEDNNNIQWSNGFWDWRDGVYNWYQEYFEKKKKLSKDDKDIQKTLKDAYWFFNDPDISSTSRHKTLNDIENYLTKIDR